MGDPGPSMREGSTLDLATCFTCGALLLGGDTAPGEVSGVDLHSAWHAENGALLEAFADRLQRYERALADVEAHTLGETP